MKRIPFNYSLFFNAVAGLIGRCYDGHVDAGWEGYYERWFFPKDKAEEERFHEYARIIAGWMNIFDIQFAGSRCEFGKAYPPSSDPIWDKVLQIKITFTLQPKKDEKIPVAVVTQLCRYGISGPVEEQLKEYRALLEKHGGKMDDEALEYLKKEIEALESHCK